MNKNFPIYRDANQLVIETEITVKQFSRYHKYTLGSEMRMCAYKIIENISLAINQLKNMPNNKQELIKRAHRETEKFKIKIQIAQSLKIFPNFKRFEVLAKTVVSVSKQCFAWNKKIATPRHPQGDATTKEVNVGWAKRAQPNTRVTDNSIVGLHCVLQQPTVNANIFDIIFKQSKLKPYWCECHQANLPKVLKTLQTNSVSYVVVTQQGYINNKLRKRKVSQIYISNNLNPKEAA